jgi:hypothetical protein
MLSIIADVLGQILVANVIIVLRLKECKQVFQFSFPTAITQIIHITITKDNNNIAFTKCLEDQLHFPPKNYNY